MAKLEGHSTINTEIMLRLSMVEAAALDALVGYGADSFLKVFYEHLGQHYLKPYEVGLRSLFDSVRNGDASVALFLQRTTDAKDVFEGRKVAISKEKS